MYKSNRLSNIELLRIVAMLMIVLSHFSFHGFFSEEYRYNWIDNELNKYFLRIIQMGSLGVDVFVLITGYNLINDNKIKITKVVKLLGQVFFYTIGILIVLYSLRKPIDANMIVNSLLPISGNLYWFVGCYFVLYILHPYLNKVVIDMGESGYFRFIIILLILFSFFHTFLNREMYANNLVHFVVLYYIGGFLKINGLKVSGYTLAYLSLFWLSIPLVAILTDIQTLIDHSTFFYTQMSILTIALSVALFCKIAISTTPFMSKSINIVASSCLAVYLVHDNAYLREIFYNDFFHIKSYAEMDILPIIIICDSLIVFITCVSIDLIRRCIFIWLSKLKVLLPPKVVRMASYEIMV